MSKLSDGDARAFQKLVKKYGFEELAGVDKFEENRGGRPKDPIEFNEAIIAGHVEFLRLHGVEVRTKKIDAACYALKVILDRYTPFARKRAASTLKKIYKTTRKKAKEGNALIAAVMNTTYGVLVEHLAGHPNKIAIPHLIEGSSEGEKFAAIDTTGCAFMVPIECHGVGFIACLTIIVTPE